MMTQKELCIKPYGFLVIAMVEFIHESEALNVVSGASDTVLIGKVYMTYMTE